ncbi:MAG: transposase [Pilosibacter sp.]
MCQCKTYYRSPDCTGCPYKTECIKGNNCKTPMEKRNKVLMVSKTMSQKRAEDLERITSEYGTMLRMNRSIQAEGSFADVKEGHEFSKISVPRKSKCTGREHPSGDGTKYQ